MQLLDLNQAMYSTFFVSIGKHTNIAIEEPLVRHMVLNMIRALNVKFRNEYGELIIASDSRTYWRKEYFPYYKAARKKAREKSDLDWTSVFECMNRIKSELQEYFPYKYIEVSGAEADDVIGTICNSIDDEKILIISGDKDYRQLHTSKIKQYDPVNSKYLYEENPKEYLQAHIMKGDVGDGIPNIASADNCFVINERQRRVTKKLIDQFEEIRNDEYHKYYRNFIRNKTLIDLKEVPDNIQNEILDKLEMLNTKDKSQLINYFSTHKLKKLVECINDF